MAIWQNGKVSAAALALKNLLLLKDCARTKESEYVTKVCTENFHSIYILYSDAEKHINAHTTTHARTDRQPAELSDRQI